MGRMILAVLVAVSLSALTFADESPPALPASSQAVQAKKKHDAAIKEARETLHKAIIAADQEYIADLDTALKAAMLNQDIDSARVLDDRKKAAQAALKRDQAKMDADNGRGQIAIVGTTVKQGAMSLSLPHGAQAYIYGMTTGGGFDASSFNGTAVSVNNRLGHPSVQLAVSNQPENQFSTGCAYYAIGGCGVSGYGSLTALYRTNEGPAASSASVSFALDGPATVVLVGLASGQQTISFDGLSNLQTDVPAPVAGPDGTVAVAIGHADLQAGKYTVRALTSAAVGGQNPSAQADLLGVFVFSADGGIVSSQSPTLAIPNDIAAPQVVVP